MVFVGEPLVSLHRSRFLAEQTEEHLLLDSMETVTAGGGGGRGRNSSKMNDLDKFSSAEELSVWSWNRHCISHLSLSSFSQHKRWWVQTSFCVCGQQSPVSGPPPPPFLLLKSLRLHVVVGSGQKDFSSFLLSVVGVEKMGRRPLRQS